MTGTRTAENSNGHRRERRQYSRFRLTGLAWFQWEASNGRQCKGEGATRNVSKEGAFIETANIPPVASKLKVVMTLRGRVNEDMEVRLCGVGSVRHAGNGGDAVGFGAEVLFHTEAPPEAR